MIVSKYLSEKLDEMRKELEVMRPAYESYMELQRAIVALEKAVEGRASRAPRGAKKADLGKNRTEQLARLIASEPGLTVNALAQRLEMSRSYADRVLRTLEKAGRIERRETEGGGRDQWTFWPKS